MFYDLTKTAHLIALFVWVGGMIAVALALRYPTAIDMRPLKSYDRTVTTPAMLLALLFGVLLGIQGAWFTSAWLGMKILLVVGIAALHGALVGRLRRAIENNTAVTSSGERMILPVGLLLLTLVVFLVTMKP